MHGASPRSIGVSMVTQAGGLNRTQGTRLNELNLAQGGQDQGIQGLSDKALADLISKFLNPQNAQQAQGGGGQQGGGGGPQGAGGAKGGGESQFSLEELLKEMQRRQEQQQLREANQRGVNPTKQANGNGQQQPGPFNNIAAQLVAMAPPDLVASVNGSSGGGFTGGG